MSDVFSTEGQPEPFETHMFMNTFYSAYDAGIAVDTFRNALRDTRSYKDAINIVALRTDCTPEQIVIWLSGGQEPELPSS
jgi:hypothetical protein